jgi:HD superfamily phosphodiesterase
MDNINKVLNAMIFYYEGDAKRINHFLKVYGFAKVIGAMEGLDDVTQEVLEIASLTHDIGIRNSEIKYHSSSGSYQQIEGPPEAQKMLQALVVNEPIIERVCWLIAHHHTYSDIDGIDYQILVEADFLVNIFEDKMPMDSIKSIREKIFKTESGLKMLDNMY